MQVKKQQLEPEKGTGSELGREYVKAVYCHPAYLTYMQSAYVHAKSLQSCLTLCDSIDYCRLGFSVHWLSHTRILECVVISLSRGSL